jgi:hypothetical protein
MRYRATTASICVGSFMMNGPCVTTGSRISAPDRIRKCEGGRASNVTRPPPRPECQRVSAVHLLRVTVGADHDVPREDIDNRVVSSLEIEGDLPPQLDIQQGERLGRHER